MAKELDQTIQSHAKFLFNLQGADPSNASRIIKAASQSELVALCKIVHNIVLGKIPIKTVSHDGLKRAKKLNRLKIDFGSKERVNQLLTATEDEGNRHKKLETLLLTYKSVFGYILQAII